MDFLAPKAGRGAKPQAMHYELHQCVRVEEDGSFHGFVQGKATPVAGGASRPVSCPVSSANMSQRGNGAPQITGTRPRLLETDGNLLSDAFGDMSLSRANCETTGGDFRARLEARLRAARHVEGASARYDFLDDTRSRQQTTTRDTMNASRNRAASFGARTYADTTQRGETRHRLREATQETRFEATGRDYARSKMAGSRLDAAGYEGSSKLKTDRTTSRSRAHPVVDPIYTQQEAPASSATKHTTRRSSYSHGSRVTKEQYQTRHETTRAATKSQDGKDIHSKAKKWLEQNDLLPLLEGRLTHSELKHFPDAPSGYDVADLVKEMMAQRPNEVSLKKLRVVFHPDRWCGVAKEKRESYQRRALAIYNVVDAMYQKKSKR